MPKCARCKTEIDSTFKNCEKCREYFRKWNRVNKKYTDIAKMKRKKASFAEWNSMIQFPIMLNIMIIITKQ